MGDFWGLYKGRLTAFFSSTWILSRSSSFRWSTASLSVTAWFPVLVGGLFCAAIASISYAPGPAR